MRHSMTEANFKKPLFKKLATVRDYFEKNKTGNDNEKMKASASAKYWKTIRDDRDEKAFTHADALDAKIVQFVFMWVLV